MRKKIYISKIYKQEAVQEHLFASTSCKFCGSASRNPKSHFRTASCATVAQMAEHLTRNEDVRGSIPRGGSNDVFLPP